MKDLIQTIIDSISNISTLSSYIKKNHPDLYAQIDSLWPSTVEAKTFAQKIHYAWKSPTITCECGNPLVFYNITIGYSRFCSNRCEFFKKDKSETQARIRAEETNEQREQRKEKILKASSEKDWSEVRERARQTLIQKYGVDNPIKIEGVLESRDHQEIAKKGKQTRLERYGHVGGFADEKTRQKAQQTVEDRYGVRSTTQIPEIHERPIRTLKEHYGSLYSKEIRERITTTNLERYNHHTPAGKNWRPGVYEIITNKEDLGLLIAKHGLDGTATHLEIHPRTVYNYAVKHGLHAPRKYRSIAETQLATLFDKHGINYVRNTKSIIHPYELDFYFPDHNLAVEYNGLYWHSDIHPRITPEYHYEKYRRCKEKDIRLVQIFSDEYEDRKESVENTLLMALGVHTTSIGARKTKVIELNHHQAAEFYDTYHHFGSTRATVHYGLEYDGNLVAAMSFKKIAPFKRHAEYSNTWDLCRFATSHLRVQGGASKILKHFQYKHEWDVIISYADLRWSVGTLYERLGFTHEGETKPDYSYTCDFKTRDHKFIHRKKRYSDKYDISVLTESQIMAIEGYARVWDCGKIRYALFKS